ncbi:unnamed protein product, partial [Brenthis ino]
MKIGNHNINYAKFGHGPHCIVCIPGALGTITSHYKDQIDGFDKEKFTIVSFDPVGFGKSYPLEKIFVKSNYEQDADTAYELMKRLNIPKYSCLGWSAGGAASLILAGKYPHAIHKLVVWGTNAFVLEEDIANYRKIQDVERWSTHILKQRMIETYGKEKFAQYWYKWVGQMADVLEADPDICKDLLKNISCPTFILHGERDAIAHISHVAFLCNHIKNAKSYVYPMGKHDIHMQYVEDFNQRVQEFLLEK